MPVNISLMKSLIKKYGKEKAKGIYYSMEADGNKATKAAAIRKSQKDHPEFYKKIAKKLAPKKKK